MTEKLLFLIVVLLSNIIQCITGFAGTVLAMPFSVMLVGYGCAKPILNVLGIAASVFIVIKDYKFINKKELVKMTIAMLIGICGGLQLKNIIGNNENLLYKILGIIVISFAVFNAYRFYTKKDENHFPAVISAALLIISGVVHGLFVCGGPLLVTYLSGKLKDKSEFRATLSAVWIILNTIMMLSDIKDGCFTGSTLILLAASLAVLALALYIGNLIYKKMSKSVFLQLTYILMLISGASLIVK